MLTKSILFFHPHTAKGGTEQNIVKISKGLKDHGYVVHFCAFEDNGDLYEELKHFACSTHILSNITKSPVKSINTYLKILRTINPDFVLNFGLRVDLFSRVFSPTKNRIVVSNIRSTDDWRKWYHTILDKLTQSRVDFWISNSQAGRKAFSKREGIPESKIKVIYNFIENISDLKRSYNKPQGTLLKIGVLANIRPAKGHETLIEVASILKRQKVNFKFILAGADMMNGTLIEEIRMHGLDIYFEHRGFVKDIDSLLKEIDISLLPSRWEGMPTSVLEAMSKGLPVIATRVGGVPEIIDDRMDGYIVAVGDASMMAKTIIELTSAEQRAKIGRAAKSKIVDRFSKNTILEQWINTLN